MEKPKDDVLEEILAEQFYRYDERNDDHNDEFDSHKFDKVAENIDRVERKQQNDRKDNQQDEEDKAEQDHQKSRRDYEDDIDSVLQMNPGNYSQNLLGGALEKKDVVDVRSPKRKETKPKLKIEEEKQQARPKNTKSSKYDEFMQFMENIEEEMSS